MLDAVEMKCIRRVCGVTRVDRERNLGYEVGDASSMQWK